MSDFDSNWQNSMMGHLGYHEVAGDEGGDDKGKGKAPEEPVFNAPKNYKPSTKDQRTKWNQFLDYLEKKGVGGSKDLDARDKGLGIKYLNEYNKANPDSAVSKEFIPTAQYESYLIRRKNTFPGLTPEQGQYAFGNLAPAFKNKQISGVDNWLGSNTSRQYYPTFHHGEKGNSKDLGTNFEDFVKAAGK